MCLFNCLSLPSSSRLYLSYRALRYVEVIGSVTIDGYDGISEYMPLHSYYNTKKIMYILVIYIIFNTTTLPSRSCRSKHNMESGSFSSNNTIDLNFKYNLQIKTIN
mgnify:FL=1